MDEIYRQQRHIYDFTREYFLLGRDHLIRDIAAPDGGHVLEIACGTGRNLARVATARPDLKLYGFDISEEMLATARKSLARQGLKESVRLAQGDACGFQPEKLFGVKEFDVIFMSYCLSMIPDWKGALNEAARHLAPGGKLTVVDFGDQEKLPGWFRSLLQAWLAKFHVAPRINLDEAMAQAATRIGGSAEVTVMKRDYCRYGVLTAPA